MQNQHDWSSYIGKEVGVQEMGSETTIQATLVGFTDFGIILTSKDSVNKFANRFYPYSNIRYVDLLQYGQSQGQARVA